MTRIGIITAQREKLKGETNIALDSCSRATDLSISITHATRAIVAAIRELTFEVMVINGGGN